MRKLRTALAAAALAAGAVAVPAASARADQSWYTHQYMPYNSSRIATATGCTQLIELIRTYRHPGPFVTTVRMTRISGYCGASEMRLFGYDAGGRFILRDGVGQQNGTWTATLVGGVMTSAQMHGWGWPPMEFKVFPA